MTTKDHGTHYPLRSLFLEWPEKVPKRGVLITTLGEQIPFSNFLTGDSLLLLERTTPDTSGARTILLPYEHVDSVKLVDVVKSAAFKPLGFK